MTVTDAENRLVNGQGPTSAAMTSHADERKRAQSIDILVVDDEPIVLDFIVRVLQQEGHRCRAATDASEALSETLKRAPTLTISDVRMPGKEGTWLLQELKSRWPEMAVIMLTGFAEAKTAVQCLKNGADDYLVKPIDLDELLIAVNRAIERSSLLRETQESRHSLRHHRARTARLHAALQVIESTYQEAIGALIHPEAAPSPRSLTDWNVEPSSREQSSSATANQDGGAAAEPEIELSVLRNASKMIGAGAAYRDVAVVIAEDLVTIGGLASARVWTTRRGDILESIVARGECAVDASLPAPRPALARDVEVIERDAKTYITCPISLTGVPVDILELCWSSPQTAKMVAFAERLSLVLSVALAREKDARDRHRTAEEVDLLYKLAAASRHSLDLEHVADFLLGSLHRIVDYDVAGLLLLNEDPTLNIRTRFPSSESATERVKNHVLTNLKLTCGVDPPEDLKIIEQHVVGHGNDRTAPQKLRSFVNVPLTVGGSVVGLIHVSSGRDQTFSEGEVLFVHRVANFLASSVQGIRDLVAAVKGRVEQMVDHMSDAVVMLDRRGNVVAMNRAARSVLGFSDDPEEAMDAQRLTHLLDFDPLSLAQGGPSVRRLVCLRGVAHQAEISPITDPDGALVGAVVAFRNFEQEKKVDELKTELVNVVSHELRTPLTAINNAVSLLRGSRLRARNAEKQEYFLALMQRNVDQLITIINDLLDLSKIESGKMRVDLRPISISVPVQSAIDSLKAQAETKGVTLDSDFASDLPPVHGNEAALQRVLVNLVGNAIKFTGRGGEIAVKIELYRRDHGAGTTEAIKVSVSDSGAGIPEEQLESIFDKFYQVTGENRYTTTVGTGLGLPISRQLIMAHHGEIWAENIASGGSRFSFVIPLLTDTELVLRALSTEVARARTHNTSVALSIARLSFPAEAVQEGAGVERSREVLVALRETALKVARRPSDHVFVESDESQIAVILPNTLSEEAKVFEARLTEELEKNPLAAGIVRVTVSSAIAPDDAISSEGLYEVVSERLREIALA